jgi:TRAP-type uncharacterized transport system fused permease subunit
MLIVLPEYFTLASFLQVSITCALGIFAIGTAVAGFFLTSLKALMRLVMAIAGVLLVAPGLGSDVAAVIILIPVLMLQLAQQKAAATPGAAT